MQLGKRIMKTVLITALLLVAISATAANVYIRSGGSGAGTSWSDALGALPATVTRGNVYYLGNGLMAAQDMDASPNNGAYIEFRKATAADHGTETGWSDTYTNQAVITGNSWVNYSRWCFNGVYRDESNPPYSWTNVAGYGIQWIGTNETKLISFGRRSGVISDSNVVQYVAFRGNTNALGGTDEARYILDWYSGGATGSYKTNYVGNNFIQGGSVAVFLSGNTGFNSSSNNLIERNWIERQAGNGANHGEPIDLYFTVHDTTIVNNVFRFTRGGISAIVAVGGSSGAQRNIHFVGNLVYDCETSVLFGFGESDRSQGQGDLFLFNTIADRYNCCSLGTAVYTGSGNLAYNNIWYNTQTGFAHEAGMIHTNNAYGWSYSETGGIPGIPSSYFNNYAAKNFQLATNFARGYTNGLPAWAMVDMRGKYRGGTNGMASIGAFQHTTDQVTVLPAPQLYIQNLETGVIIQTQ